MGMDDAGLQLENVLSVVLLLVGTLRMPDDDDENLECTSHQFRILQT